MGATFKKIMRKTKTHYLKIILLAWQIMLSSHEKVAIMKFNACCWFYDLIYAKWFTLIYSCLQWPEAIRLRCSVKRCSNFFNNSQDITCVWVSFSWSCKFAASKFCDVSSPITGNSQVLYVSRWMLHKIWYILFHVTSCARC